MDEIKSNVASEAKPEVTNEANVETPKKKRRGLGSVRGASRLKFSKDDYNRSNGLFIGHLDNVEMKWATQKEDNATSFAGLAVPYLAFTFASNHDKEADRRYITLRVMPVESSALTIEGGDEEWKFNQQMGWLKHILDVFVLRGKPMTEEMEDKLALSYVDTDEEGQYVPVEPEEVLAGWRALFENFIAILENDGKPYYKNDKGGILPVWMKLLKYVRVRDRKTKEMHWTPVASGNQAGDYSFTNFVGEGAIEIYHQDKAPNLRVDVSKESVTDKEVPNKPKTPNMPAIPGVPTTGVTPANIGIGGAAPIGGAGAFDPNANYGTPVTGEDLPF